MFLPARVASAAAPSPALRTSAWTLFSAWLAEPMEVWMAVLSAPTSCLSLSAGAVANFWMAPCSSTSEEMIISAALVNCSPLRLRLRFSTGRYFFLLFSAQCAR
jgi:hypothetical protein